MSPETAQPAGGESLASVLAREGRAAPDRALAWMKEVAGALAEAHAAGVLHCDVQPAAVLVSPEGHASLAESALARPRAEDGGGGRPPEPAIAPLYYAPEAGRVRAPEPAVAPLYYPPEAGRGKPLDERSDLYLLGCTFFHALAGQPPFDGATDEDRALQHIRNDAPALSGVIPSAPVLLCLTIQKLLRRDPEERYQTAAEVVEALGRIEAVFSRTQKAPRAERPRRRAAEPEQPQKPEKPERARTFTERDAASRRRMIIGTVAACILLAGAVVVLLLLPGQRQAARAPEPVLAPRSVAPEAEGPQPRPRVAPRTRREPILLRAADASIEGDIKLETEPDKQCIGMWYGEEAHASWQVPVSAPGDLVVEVAYAAMAESVGNEFVVAMDGQELRGLVRGTSAWTSFETLTLGRVTIGKAGTHTLTVRPGKKTSPKAPLMNLRGVNLRPAAPLAGSVAPR